MSEFVNLSSAVEDAAALHAEGKLDDAVALMKRACAADPEDAALKATLRGLLREQIDRLRRARTDTTDPRRSTDPKARKMNTAQMTAAAMLFLNKPQFKAMPEKQADAYLMSKGVPAGVLAEARRRIAAGESPPRPPQAPGAPVASVGTAGGGGGGGGGGGDGNKVFGTGMHAPKIMAVSEAQTSESANGAAGETATTAAASAKTPDVRRASGTKCQSLVSMLDEEDYKRGKNSKNKRRKKVVRKKIKQTVDDVAAHLTSQRWAVCESFIPMDVVQGVRDEMLSLEMEYEASEIWVGKDNASVGAMLKVPKVRGDKVLWMCGGHLRADNQRDNLTRKLGGAAGSTAISLTGGGNGSNGKLAGKMEPCDARIRKRLRTNSARSAPATANDPPHMTKKIASGGVTRLNKEQLLRFDALQKLLSWIDRFVVGRLKKTCPELANIRERSDAMLAIYPGNGARFQRHIDNTARDGRKLTVLCYLNPEYETSQGGALRISPPSDPSDPVDVSPEAGRIAMFFADEVMHEVCPSFSDRHAITVWYYDTLEYQAAVKRSAENPPPAADEATSQESSRFMQLIVDESLAAPLAVLAEKVDALSDGALQILAGITSAPTTDDFKGAIKGMTMELLLKLRARFRGMGF